MIIDFHRKRNGLVTIHGKYKRPKRIISSKFSMFQIAPIGR